jgi:hypothetical protein
MFFLGLIIGLVVGVAGTIYGIKKFFGAFKLNW